ncbi:MAG: hypothetical protein ACXAD7_01885 [Candidatus Kariarchaeaceae archaeon]|jgi:hypothetical protein
MQIRCAWCKNTFEDKEITHEVSSLDEETSHGICLDCILDIDIFEMYDLSNISEELVHACLQGEFVLDNEGIVSCFSTSILDHVDIIHQKIIGKNLITEISPFKQIKQISKKIDELKADKHTRQDTQTYIIKHHSFYAFISIEIIYDAKSKNSILIARKLSEKTRP